ncbi:hypothetical protein SK128_006879 [Halocaridina rubra]|uniref:Uncharacterized protein n=1 Tax=Halocaridina rubra TaxID=373956 RepID=A0AAN8WPN2_HALRR
MSYLSDRSSYADMLQPSGQSNAIDATFESVFTLAMLNKDEPSFASEPIDVDSEESNACDAEDSTETNSETSSYMKTKIRLATAAKEFSEANEMASRESNNTDPMENSKTDRDHFIYANEKDFTKYYDYDSANMIITDRKKTDNGISMSYQKDNKKLPVFEKHKNHNKTPMNDDKGIVILEDTRGSEPRIYLDNPEDQKSDENSFIKFEDKISKTHSENPIVYEENVSVSLVNRDIAETHSGHLVMSDEKILFKTDNKHVAHTFEENVAYADVRHAISNAAMSAKKTSVEEIDASDIEFAKLHISTLNDAKITSETDEDFDEFCSVEINTTTNPERENVHATYHETLYDKDTSPNESEEESLSHSEETPVQGAQSVKSELYNTNSLNLNISLEKRYSESDIVGDNDNTQEETSIADSAFSSWHLSSNLAQESPTNNNLKLSNHENDVLSEICKGFPHSTHKSNVLSESYKGLSLTTDNKDAEAEVCSENYTVSCTGKDYDISGRLGESILSQSHSSSCNILSGRVDLTSYVQQSVENYKKNNESVTVGSESSSTDETGTMGQLKSDKGESNSGLTYPHSTNFINSVDITKQENGTNRKESSQAYDTIEENIINPVSHYVVDSDISSSDIPVSNEQLASNIDENKSNLSQLFSTISEYEGKNSANMAKGEKSTITDDPSQDDHIINENNTVPALQSTGETFANNNAHFPLYSAYRINILGFDTSQIKTEIKDFEETKGNLLQAGAVDLSFAKLPESPSSNANFSEKDIKSELFPSKVHDSNASSINSANGFINQSAEEQKASIGNQIQPIDTKLEFPVSVDTRNINKGFDKILSFAEPKNSVIEKRLYANADSTYETMQDATMPTTKANCGDDVCIALTDQISKSKNFMSEDITLQMNAADFVEDISAELDLSKSNIPDLCFTISHTNGENSDTLSAANVDISTQDLISCKSVGGEHNNTPNLPKESEVHSLETENIQSAIMQEQNILKADLDRRISPNPYQRENDVVHSSECEIYGNISENEQAMSDSEAESYDEVNYTYIPDESCTDITGKDDLSKASHGAPAPNDDHEINEENAENIPFAYDNEENGVIANENVISGNKSSQDSSVSLNVDRDSILRKTLQLTDDKGNSELIKDEEKLHIDIETDNANGINTQSTEVKGDAYHSKNHGKDLASGITPEKSRKNSIIPDRDRANSIVYFGNTVATKFAFEDASKEGIDVICFRKVSVNNINWEMIESSIMPEENIDQEKQLNVKSKIAKFEALQKQPDALNPDDVYYPTVNIHEPLNAIADEVTEVSNLEMLYAHNSDLKAIEEENYAEPTVMESAIMLKSSTEIYHLEDTRESIADLDDIVIYKDISDETINDNYDIKITENITARYRKNNFGRVSESEMAYSLDENGLALSTTSLHQAYIKRDKTTTEENKDIYTDTASIATNKDTDKEFADVKLMDRRASYFGARTADLLDLEDIEVNTVFENALNVGIIEGDAVNVRTNGMTSNVADAIDISSMFGDIVEMESIKSGTPDIDSFEMKPIDSVDTDSVEAFDFHRASENANRITECDTTTGNEQNAFATTDITFDTSIPSSAGRSLGIYNEAAGDIKQSIGNTKEYDIYSIVPIENYAEDEEIYLFPQETDSLQKSSFLDNTL